MTCAEVLARLKALADPRVKSQMAHFGVHAKIAYGVSTPNLRALARQAGKSHTLSAQLWASGIHEARILAGFVGEPSKVTAAQMERWARDFDTWDVVDGTCCHLFAFAAPAWSKAIAWSRHNCEFIKRAAFALMAYLAVHDKQAPNSKFLRLLPIIRRHSTDERNFVRKAVNWALRQIGKRNLVLNKAAIRTARQIRALDSRAARWIAADALRELQSPAVQRRLWASRRARPHVPRLRGRVQRGRRCRPRPLAHPEHAQFLRRTRFRPPVAVGGELMPPVILSLPPVLRPKPKDGR